jgi:hypothetical protein
MRANRHRDGRRSFLCSRAWIDLISPALIRLGIFDARRGRGVVVTVSSLVALALANGGCALFVHGRGGFAMGSDGRPTAAVDLNVGYGMGREELAFGVDVGARAKFNSALSSGSVSTGPWFALNRGRLLVFGHGGVNLLQLDAIGGTLYASAFSPYLNLGIGVNVSRVRGGYTSGQILTMNPDTNNVALTLSASAEYNLRFATAGESFFSVLLGVAFMRAMAAEDSAPERSATAATEAAVPDAASSDASAAP